MRFNSVIIQPFLPEDRLDKSLLKKRIETVVKLPVLWNRPVEIPEEAYDPARKQFLGSYFLRELVSFGSDRDIVLGIVYYDLYEPGLNFVFGVTSSFTKTAVISTYRLHNSFYGFPEDQNIFMDRVTKEAVHEIGHTLGLEHCPLISCVMHFSNSIVDTDRKSYYFCSNCFKKVMEAIGL